MVTTTREKDLARERENGGLLIINYPTCLINILSLRQFFAFLDIHFGLKKKDTKSECGENNKLTPWHFITKYRSLEFY